MMLSKRSSVRRSSRPSARQQVGPVAVALQEQQPHPAIILRLEAVDDRVRRVEAVVRLRLRAEPHLEREVPAHHVHAGAHERRRDALPLAGALALEERGGDRGGACHAGHVVAHAAALLRDRRPSGGVSDAPTPARDQNPPMSYDARFAVGAVGALAGDLAVDDARVGLRTSS